MNIRQKPWCVSFLNWCNGKYSHIPDAILEHLDVSLVQPFVAKQIELQKKVELLQQKCLEQKDALDASLETQARLRILADKVTNLQ